MLVSKKRDCWIKTGGVYVTEPQISVIIPVYNVEKYLNECIQSVRNQTYKDWEAWLIDDGSTDHSGKICDEFAQGDPRFHVVHKQNGGLSSARNQGILRARGKYIAFLDSDDYWEPEALQWQLDTAFQTNAEIVCMGLRLFKENKKQQLSYQEPFSITGEEAFRRMMLCDGIDSNATAKLFLRTLWQGYWFPEGCLFEDVPVTYHLLLQCNKVSHCGKVGYHYRYNEGSITHTFSPKRMCYTEFTKEILDFTKEKYPQYFAEAKEMYGKSMVTNLVALGKTNIHGNKELQNYEQSLRQKVVPFIPTLLKTKQITRRGKIDFLLCLIGVFRPLRSLKYLKKAY